MKERVIYIFFMEKESVMHSIVKYVLLKDIKC